MNRSQLRTIDRCIIRLEDLRGIFNHETKNDGTPLSEATVNFNRSIMKRIDAVIEQLDSLDAE